MPHWFDRPRKPIPFSRATLGDRENIYSHRPQRQQLRDLTMQIIRNAIGIFEKFNHVRNNQSLAHDNELLNKAEARFIYDSVCAILLFIKAVEADRFDVIQGQPAAVELADDELPF
jgi:hypothetical protein